MLNRKMDGNEIEGAHDVLTIKQVMRAILPYLTKNDIDALRLTDKSIYRTINLVLFSNAALLPKPRASRLLRNNILHFLSTTNQTLPEGMKASGLIDALNASDSINMYAALLRLLLKECQMDGDVSHHVANKLMSADKIYRDIFQCLAGNEYEHQQLERTIIGNPFQDIMHDLDLLLREQSNIFSKLKKAFHSNTFDFVAKFGVTVRSLNPKVMALLKKEEQEELTKKLLKMLPVFRKYVKALEVNGFFCVLSMLSCLLKQADNKSLLTKDNKKELATFICLLGNFSDNLARNCELILKKGKWWHQFQMADIIFAADLDLSLQSADFFSSAAVMKPVLDRKHAFYLALKKSYLTDYVNCNDLLFSQATNMIMMGSLEKYSKHKKIEYFLSLTTYFMDTFSNEEANLVIDKLNAIANNTMTLRNHVRESLLCLIKLYKRASVQQFNAMKDIAIKNFNDDLALEGLKADEKGLLLLLMEFAENDKTQSFRFSVVDMGLLFNYIMNHLKEFRPLEDKDDYLMQVIRVFVRLADVQQLNILIAELVSKQSVILQQSKYILSAQLVVAELTKREFFSKAMLYLREKLQYKIDLMVSIFDGTLTLHNWHQETHRLSSLVAEKSFNAELLIRSFLDYFSRVEKNVMAFGDTKIDRHFALHLIHRMTPADVLELRNALVNILNSLLCAKTADPYKIEFGRAIFKYLDFVIPLIEDDFNYLNVLFPMLVNWYFQPVQDTRERLMSIIGWQLLSKNYPLPDDSCLDNLDHAACVAIKLLAEKAKAVHQMNTPSNQPMSEFRR